MHQDDKNLIRLYIDGDTNAMNTVINRHRENLFNYINTIVKNGSLAEDILQEVFLKSIQKINEG
jgi:RNA polymerase sigma-70 factor (ECF subfamily)